MGAAPRLGPTRPDRRALGQYFTPPGLVTHVLDRAGVDGLRPGARVLEPACGDGAFLVGLVERLGPRVLELELCAYDIDPPAVHLARERLEGALRAHAGLSPARAARRASEVVREADFLAHGDPGPFDLALGNPPFLEAKRMPRDMKARLRAAHPRWTRGAFDLFVPFVGLAAERLAPGGRLAFVLPNKVCVAGYARELRRVLLEELSLRAVTDLSASRAFEGAAVYPVVLAADREAAAATDGDSSDGDSCDSDGCGPAVGRRRAVSPARRDEVETWSGARQGEGLGFEQTGRLPARFFREAPDQVLFVLPTGAAERFETRRLLEAPHRLGDYLDVRWTVSFHRAGLRDRYLFPERPDSPHARPLLGAGRFTGNADVQRYGLSWRGWWIDYDRERARVDGNALPDPALFDAPKLVICQNALRLRAACDRVGYVLKDTYFAARPTAQALDQGVALEALLGVLNSDVLHRLYATLFGMTRVNGGYLHYLGAYLRHLPVPPPERLGPPMVDAVLACEAAAAAGDEPAFEEATARVERLVRAAFGL